MTDIEFGKFTIPQITGGDNTFQGSFAFENGVVLLWFEYEVEGEQYQQLFNLVEQKELFSVQISYKRSVIWCYDCQFLNRLETVITYDDGKPVSSRRPEYGFGYLKAYSSCWMDWNASANMDEPSFHSFYVKYKYSDSWFESVKKDNDIILKDGTLISFICGFDTFSQKKPCEYRKKQAGKIYVKREKPFSIHEVMDISLSFQVFLRYVTDIQIPSGQIEFVDEEEPAIRFNLHVKEEIKGLINNPLEEKYYSMPISLQNVLSSENLLQKWFDIWEKQKDALSRFAECQNPMKSEICIINLTKTFDALSKLFFPTQHEYGESFADWINEICNLSKEKAKEKGFEIDGDRIAGLLGNLKNDSLLMRMKSFVYQNDSASYQSLIKKHGDEDEIISFVVRLRNSDSHSGKKMEKLIPDGYQLKEIARIMYLIDRDVLKQYVFSADYTKTNEVGCRAR